MRARHELLLIEKLAHFSREQEAARSSGFRALLFLVRARLQSAFVHRRFSSISSSDIHHDEVSRESENKKIPQTFFVACGDAVTATFRFVAPLLADRGCAVEQLSGPAFEPFAPHCVFRS